MSRTKQFQEEEVLQKAVELFWKKGFHATSMEELVQYLGINRASLYDTFGGKRQLFEKAIKKYIRDNEQALHAFLNKQSSLKEGLINFFHLLVKTAVQDQELKGCFVVNTTAELAPHDPEIVKILQENKLNFEEILHQFLKRGLEQHEISADKDLAAIAQYLVVFFNGLKITAKVNPDEAELNSLIRLGLKVLDD